MRNNQSIGIILVTVGALFLILPFANVDIAAFAWPFFIMIPGILLLTWALLSKGFAAPLAVPGSIVTTVGLILFYQNITGHFESWSYAWGLIAAAVGIGIALTGNLQAKAKLQQDGRRVAIIGLTMFLTFGVVFELFIFRTYAESLVWRYLLPLGLIAAGLLLFVRRRQEFRGEAEGKVPPEP